LGLNCAWYADILLTLTTWSVHRPRHLSSFADLEMGQQGSLLPNVRGRI
jgi:hypothetical protein